MNKERRHLSIGLGVPTILLVFIILCKLILSVLTYMNASSNYAGWSREKENIVSYYEADSKAKQIINELRSEKDMNSIEKKFDINFEKEERKTIFRVIIKDSTYLSIVLDENLNVLAWKRLNKEDNE